MLLGLSKVESLGFSVPHKNNFSGKVKFRVTYRDQSSMPPSTGFDQNHVQDD